MGFLGLLVTGIPQLISNAMREYYSAFFWFKMEVMVLALIYTFTLRRKVTLADETRVGPFWSKVVGLVSIVLWACVAIPARNRLSLKKLQGCRIAELQEGLK